MPPVYFGVTEHIVNAQHIREYPAATATDGAKLKLHVKHYKPKVSPPPESDAVTIIAAHANAFPKVGHFWDEESTNQPA